MSKKLLIVGNGNHQFIYNYVKWLKEKDDFSNIDILTDRTIDKKNEDIYSSIYSINRDSILFKLVSKIKGIRRYYRYYLYRQLVSSLPAYDFIHVHFLSVDNIFLANQFKGSKLILSIWGSDYYRTSHDGKKKLVEVCSKADVVTFTNELTQKDFKDKYNWKDNNLDIYRFGLAPLEHLKNLKESRIESKEILGWDKNKLAVAIGYNMSEGQQHLKILDEINKLSKYSEQIELIIPITYAGNSIYKAKIISALKSLPFNYHVYDKFLDDLTLSHIRNGSDVMIQLQVTDQFSGSMQEHLFTRNVVITGSWLPYQTMKDYGAYFIEIDMISELSEKLIEVFHNYDQFYSKTEANPLAVLELSSWERNIVEWLKLYKK